LLDVVLNLVVCLLNGLLGSNLSGGLFGAGPLLNNLLGGVDPLQLIPANKPLAGLLTGKPLFGLLQPKRQSGSSYEPEYGPFGVAQRFLKLDLSCITDIDLEGLLTKAVENIKDLLYGGFCDECGALGGTLSKLAYDLAYTLFRLNGQLAGLGVTLGYIVYDLGKSSAETPVLRSPIHHF